MKRMMMAAVIGLACVAGAAGAQATQSPAADTVHGRQAALMLSGVAMGAMKSAIDAGQAPSTQGFNSRALSRWARALPGMFPAGTGAEAGVPTKAKAEIWSDRAGFEARAAAYAAAADRLNELARADDPGFAAQWTEVRAACQSCHDIYRAD